MSSGQSYAELSDIWLCLACALGWTVWLVNSRQYLLKTDREGTIFDQEESVKVVGNVLSMKVGEDQDGTGIPVYLVLVDYVVECYDPTQTEVITNNLDYKDGVIKDQPQKGEPIQIRKCFHTNKWFESGFANIEVLVLVSDPTTSMIYGDYLLEKREQKHNVDRIWVIGAHVMALSLILVSLYGAYAAIPNLAPQEIEIGWVSLIGGIVLLYPLALYLYYSYNLVNKWMSEGRVVIINGAKNWECTRVVCGIGNALDGFEGEEDDSIKANSISASTKASKSIKKASNRNRQQKENQPTTLEMPVLPLDKQSYHPPPSSRTYPNAGCQLNNYTVDFEEGGANASIHSSTVSSISSADTGNPLQSVADSDANTLCSTQIIEQFRSLASGSNGS